MVNWGLSSTKHACIIPSWQTATLEGEGCSDWSWLLLIVYCVNEHARVNLWLLVIVNCAYEHVSLSTVVKLAVDCKLCHVLVYVSVVLYVCCQLRCFTCHARSVSVNWSAWAWITIVCGNEIRLQQMGKSVSNRTGQAWVLLLSAIDRKTYALLHNLIAPTHLVAPAQPKEKLFTNIVKWHFDPKPMW